MPIPLAPNTSPADASGAFAILEIIGNETKFKKRLQELQDQAKEIEKMVDNSKKLDADSKKRLKDVEDRIAALDHREVDLKNREASLGNARRDTLALQEHLNVRQAKFDEDMEKRGKLKEAGLTKWAAELTEKEKMLNGIARDLEGERNEFNRGATNTSRVLTDREQNVAKREQDLKQGFVDLEEKKTALQAKMAKLDELRAAIQTAA